MKDNTSTCCQKREYQSYKTMYLILHGIKTTITTKLTHQIPNSALLKLVYLLSNTQ